MTRDATRSARRTRATRGADHVPATETFMGHTGGAMNRKTLIAISVGSILGATPAGRVRRYEPARRHDGSEQPAAGTTGEQRARQVAAAGANTQATTPPDIGVAARLAPQPNANGGDHEGENANGQRQTDQAGAIATRVTSAMITTAATDPRERRHCARQGRHSLRPPRHCSRPGRRAVGPS